MKPKKSLGQHFLIQPAIAERTARALQQVHQGDLVVEVGPGRGMLTQFLIDAFSRVLLVEKDPVMLPVLQERFPHLGDRLILGDFLHTDFRLLAGESSCHIIGNFPYNISSQILFKVLDCKNQVPQLVGMFQKEVAQRICAPHGNKEYGILSVLIQLYYSAEILFDVSPANFNPPPKVRSAVIRLSRRERFEVEPTAERALKTIVKAAFNQRRKMLRNSLKAYWPDRIEHDDPVLSKRPEQLSVSDFVALNRSLLPLKNHQ